MGQKHTQVEEAFVSAFSPIILESVEFIVNSMLFLHRAPPNSFSMLFLHRAPPNSFSMLFLHRAPPNSFWKESLNLGKQCNKHGRKQFLHRVARCVGVCVLVFVCVCVCVCV